MDLRKIDALVAEKVMGWTLSPQGEWHDSAGVYMEWHEHESKHDPCYNCGRSKLWRPTEDMMAAWEVLAEMKHWHPRLSYCDTTMVWSLEWTKPRRDDLKSLVTTVDEPGFDQLPLVICLAALKARGIDV